MIHINFGMVRYMDEVMNILLNSIQKSLGLKFCFTSRYVTMKYTIANYIVLEIPCIEVDSM